MPFPFFDRYGPYVAKVISMMEGRTAAGVTVRPPAIGTWRYSKGGTWPWIGTTGLHDGYYPAGEFQILSAGEFVKVESEEDQLRYALALIVNPLSRLMMFDTWLDARSWSYETAGRPQRSENGQLVTPPCQEPYDEPLYGDTKVAAGAIFFVPLTSFQADNYGFPWVGEVALKDGVQCAVVKVYGDEQNHAARHALGNLCTNPAFKGKWRVSWLGNLIDLQDAAKAALKFVGRIAANQLGHPYTVVNGCSDRGFARGLANVVYAAGAGQLDAPEEAKVIAYLRGPGFQKTYLESPAAAINIGKGDPTLTPPIPADVPCWQFFGMGIIPASCFLGEMLLRQNYPNEAANLKLVGGRLARYTSEIQGDASKPSPGYVMIPPAMRNGGPPPASLVPYLQDGTCVPCYGGGTESGKLWCIQSFFAGEQMGAGTASMAQALVAQAYPSLGSRGFCADEHGQLVTP